MAKRDASVRLELGRPAALQACREAVSALGWAAREVDGPNLVAEEDPAGLCCVVWPVEVAVEIIAEGDSSLLELTATTPGRGPIQQRQLRERLGRLERELRHRASAETR